MEQTRGGWRVSAWCRRSGERRHEFVQDLARQFDVVLGEFQRPPRIDFVKALGDQPAEVVVHSGASRQRRVDARRGADGRVVPCWQRRHRTLRHAHRLTGRRVAGRSPDVHAHTNVEDVLAQAICLYAAYHIPRGPHNKLVANNLTSVSACVSSCGCFSMFRTQTDIFTSEVTTWMTPITHSSVLLIV